MSKGSFSFFNTTNDLSQIITDSIRQQINEGINKIFEEREIAHEKLGWSPAEFNRIFEYREIVIEKARKSTNKKKLFLLIFPNIQNLKMKNINLLWSKMEFYPLLI